MLEQPQRPVVRAAGGVVWRRKDGRVEVLLVHKSRYDDWTLPKGKVEHAEGDARAALREVEDETGLCCHLGPELPSTSYVDHEGRHRTVRYWAMQGLGGQFSPGDEVDAIQWVPVLDAPDHLTYQWDGPVVTALLTRLPLIASDA